MPQFLLDSADVAPEGGEAVLKGEEAHHLLRVFRARSGDRVELFDGAGHRWRGRLLAGRDGSNARVGDLEPLPPNEAPVAIVLLQSLIKGERWEWLIAKATELGAAAIIPVRSRRSVRAPRAERAGPRMLRWRAVALAAAKQCERAKVPMLAEPQDLPEVLRALGTPTAAEGRLVFVERALGRPLPPASPVERVYLAVGPEGGWDHEEQAAYRRAGFEEVSLGPRVLRAETAALAALVLAQARWGDLVTTADPC